MQNFSDDHLPLVDGSITVPTGDGAEAFVDAEDIAAVAAETLANPEAHAGAQYAPTGSEALTVANGRHDHRRGARPTGHAQRRGPRGLDLGRGRRWIGTRRVRRDAPLAHRDRRVRQRISPHRRRPEGHRSAADDDRGVR
jgi:hypothetical protein